MIVVLCVLSYYRIIYNRDIPRESIVLHPRVREVGKTIPKKILVWFENLCRHFQTCGKIFLINLGLRRMLKYVVHYLLFSERKPANKRTMFLKIDGIPYLTRGIGFCISAYEICKLVSYTNYRLSLQSNKYGINYIKVAVFIYRSHAYALRNFKKVLTHRYIWQRYINVVSKVAFICRSVHDFGRTSHKTYGAVDVICWVLISGNRRNPPGICVEPGCLLGCGQSIGVVIKRAEVFYVLSLRSCDQALSQ